MEREESYGYIDVPGVTWEEGENLDYATIAKAGGRRDLLYHIEHVKNPEVATWPQSVDWFAHGTPPPRLKGIYDSPLKHHWCQWNTEPLKLPKIVDGLESKKRQTKKEERQLLALIKRDSVDFTRLLSMDYQREWLQKRQEKEDRRKSLVKERKQVQLKKTQEHSMKVRQSHVPDLPIEKKKFVMKRFTGIPAKVKLPPIGHRK